jgi:hypothetical protein
MPMKATAIVAGGCAVAVALSVAACRATGGPVPVAAKPSDGASVTTESGTLGSTPPAASATPGPSGTSAKPSTPATRPPAPGSCPIFPADNVWHADVSGLPVHRNSATYVATIGTSRPVHPDFGSGLLEGKPWGIPVTTVPPGQAGVPVSFDVDDESDRGPYPIPRGALVEGGPNGDGDRHVIAFDPRGCKVYEMHDAHPAAGSGWHAYSGAVFDLRGNRMRPTKWTSADAAGLSILAGLVRYDEVAAGHVDHAIRMTVPDTQRAFVWPASHYASTKTDPSLPPMGLRLRLKASVNIAGMPPQARAVAEALKRYGAIIADNGSPWYFSGTQDSRWNNGQIDALKRLRGSDFEVVDTAGLMVSPTSYAVRH